MTSENIDYVHDAEARVNGFLNSSCSTGVFSKTVEDIRKIRRKKNKKKRLNVSQKQEILANHLFISDIAANADPALFREKVPESEIKCWLDFTIAEMRRLGTTQKWITTGNLEQQDTYVLSNCISMFNYPLPVVLAFESDFFEALGDLVKARRGDDGGRALPADEISESIELIVCNGYYTTRSKFDNNWTPERSFRKLDDCGALEEFFRCATVPCTYVGTENSESVRTMRKVLFDELQECPVILNKRFKRDDPCGRVVRDILNGTDGSNTPRPDIIRRLQEILNFVESKFKNKEFVAKMTKLCRNCGKNDPSDTFQASLMRCGRCQTAYYCSKACQQADWNEHKKSCKRLTNSSQKEMDAIKEILNKFAQEAFVDVMLKMVTECHKTGTSKKDMLVVLDFLINKDGIVPAMQDPPMYEVVPIQMYLDPSLQAEEPDWVKTPELRAMHQQTIQNNIHAIKTQYSKRTPQEILVFITFKGGQFCCKMKYGHFYSDETCEALSTALYDGDVEPLMAVLQHDELGQFILTAAGKKYGIESFPGLRKIGIAEEAR